MTLQSLSNSAQKVQDTLNAHGVPLQVVQLEASTRSAAEAAAAIGCEVKQICKSLIFMTAETHEPVLIIASGINRVDEKKIAALVNQPIKKADAAFVLEKTGFAIGGIPPVGHKEKINHIIIDKDLMTMAELWAAAGTPHAVFCLTPTQLVEITSGQIESI